MMIFRPQGIIPSRRRAREIAQAESGIGGADALGAPGAAPVTAPLTARTPAPVNDPILEVRDVTLRFGGVISLDEVSLHAAARRDPVGDRPERRRQDVAVQLPDRRLSAARRRDHPAPPGRTPRRSSGRKPHTVTRLGIARTFQNIRLFNALTAFENVKIGVEARQHTGPIGAMLRLPRTRREERESDERAFELLEFVGLRDRANELASSLPYGDQRRLEIARALGTSPELLLLDEPAAGTNPSEKVELERADPTDQHRDRHDDPADRARHAARHVGRGAGRRAELRAGHRGGHAGARCRRIRP